MSVTWSSALLAFMRSNARILYLFVPALDMDCPGMQKHHLPLPVEHCTAGLTWCPGAAFPKPGAGPSAPALTIQESHTGGPASSALASAQALEPCLMPSTVLVWTRHRLMFMDLAACAPFTVTQMQGMQAPLHSRHMHPDSTVTTRPRHRFQGMVLSSAVQAPTLKVDSTTAVAQPSVVRPTFSTCPHSVPESSQPVRR